VPDSGLEDLYIYVESRRLFSGGVERELLFFEDVLDITRHEGGGGAR
jgi:hypothetical protein